MAACNTKRDTEDTVAERQDLILELCDLDFIPPGRDEEDGRDGLFHGLSLRVPKGAFVLLKGDSGCGKSTLLRLLARLEEPTRGCLRFHGKEYAHYNPPELRSRVCYLQQSPTVLDASVRENLLLPFGFKRHKGHKTPSDNDLRAALDELLLQAVDLTDNAATLSVGQKQRLCLARTLLLEPEVLLLDEPTSALDPESRKVVNERTEQANLERGVTVLLVSHHEDEEHARTSPSVVRLGATPQIPEALQ